MKTIMTVLALMSTTVFAADPADNWTHEQKKCDSGVYCVEKMVCIARVDKPYPRQMHSDYYQHVVGIRSFKSVKNTAGGKVLVDSLQVSAEPVGPAPIDMDRARAEAKWDYGAYGAPMYVRGNKVRLNLGISSNFSKGTNFKILSSRVAHGGRIDTLVGKEKTVGDVVGDLTTTLECEAFVVEAPTRVDDLTRK